MWRAAILGIWLAIGLIGGSRAVLAADAAVHVIAPPEPAVAVEEPHAVETTKPLKPPPHVAYGCKRVWRCDAEVCEWRRGCWGVYGYMEGPYYNEPLAKRQYQRDGWPAGRSSLR
jgi:hypothetical protein